MSQTTFAAAPASQGTTRRQWLALLVLSLGLAIIIIDGTIVNVAIPSIQREFNASFKSLEWINSVYSLIFASLIITWGRVGDQIGRKRIFIPGVAVFVLGSIFAGAARGTNMPFTIGNWTWPFTEISITPVAFALGAVMLVLFVWWELHLQRLGADPLFDFTLLRFHSFRFGLITVSIVALGEFGLVFVLSLFLQSVRGLTAFQTGLTLLPFALLTLLVAPTAGILSSRFGPRWVVTTGMLIEAIAIFSLSRTVSLSAPLTAIIAILMVYGVGAGPAIAQLTSVVLSEVPFARLGAGSGANNTIRQLGAAMGIAIIGAVLTSTLAAPATTQLQATQVVPPLVKTAIIQGLEKSGGAGEGASLQGAPAGFESTPAGWEISQIIKRSFVDGARRAGEVASIFVLLGAISSLFIPNTSPRRTRGVVPAE